MESSTTFIITQTRNTTQLKLTIKNKDHAYGEQLSSTVNVL